MRRFARVAPVQESAGLENLPMEFAVYAGSGLRVVGLAFRTIGTSANALASTLAAAAHAQRRRSVTLSPPMRRRASCAYRRS